MLSGGGDGRCHLGLLSSVSMPSLSAASSPPPSLTLLTHNSATICARVPDNPLPARFALSRLTRCRPSQPHQAVLINSANLMGGSSEPDGIRGFGRIHLEAGLPLDGTGFRALLVADSSTSSVANASVVEYTFQTDGDEDAVELRATLAWIDPPATTLSSTQLVHDLDLVVTAPSGTRYTMWSNGTVDSANVIERVIVPAVDFAAETNGTWAVTVSANELSTESQSYSLVVLGPFGNGTAIDVVGDYSAASPNTPLGTNAGIRRLLPLYGTLLGVAVVAGALLIV